MTDLATAAMSDAELDRALDIVYASMMLAQTHTQRQELWQRQQALLAEQERRETRHVG